MKTLLSLLIFFQILTADGFPKAITFNGNYHIFTINNINKTINSKQLENAFKSNNFFLAQNADIGHELKEFFHVEDFHIYNHISFYHRGLTQKLLIESPKSGIVAPMGVVMFQRKTEDKLYIIVPKADMHAKIIGLESVNLKILEKTVLELIQTLFPTALYTNSSSVLLTEKELFTQYGLHIGSADYEDAKEELEENFEELFEEAGFAMPSYFDFTDQLSENSPYDFYVTYAICKLDTLRDIATLYPESAALGPCTTVIYKKKDENKIMMGFSSIYNWISHANITDVKAKHSLLQTQKVYENILREVTKSK